MPKKAGAKPDPSTRILEAGLAIAARGEWRQAGLAAIAVEAGLPLSEVYAYFPSKLALLDAFTREIDLQSVQGSEDGEGEPTRDRLFDILMRRFDALAPHKPAVAMLLREARRDPMMIAGGGAALLRSMALTLEASGMSSAGLRAMLRAKLLGALYLSVLKTWLADDSADMRQTMAILDRRLRGAAPWLGLPRDNAAAKSAGESPSPS